MRETREFGYVVLICSPSGGPLPFYNVIKLVGFDLDDNEKGVVFDGVNDNENRWVINEMFTSQNINSKC